VNAPAHRDDLLEPWTLRGSAEAVPDYGAHRRVVEHLAVENSTVLEHDLHRLIARQSRWAIHQLDHHGSTAEVDI
jgi:hypothetical protein